MWTLSSRGSSERSRSRAKAEQSYGSFRTIRIIFGSAVSRLTRRPKCAANGLCWLAPLPQTWPSIFTL
jgi:hypothetical protein